MDFIEAIVLGIIQGLTEFLPVSSSGHLELGKAILGSVPEEGMLMTIVLHFATALSTMVIFRRDIVEIFGGLLKVKNNEETRFSLMIVLSMIPAAMIGVFFEDQIDAIFSGNLGLVGAMLILTGGLLFVADRARATEGIVTITRSIVIGIAQAIAILPGISRSGATIGTSVLLGIDRQKAARFSFLMVVPLIFGAMAVKMKNYMEVSSLEELTAQQRSEEIISELEKDYKFQSDEVYSAVLYKEQIWEGLKEGKLKYTGDEKSDFKKDLMISGFSDSDAEAIANDNFSGFRPYNKTSMAVIIIGFIVAFITGLFACTWMIALVKRSQLKYFSYYCFAVGALAIGWAII